MSSRTVFIGLDACDLYVAQQFARDGDMPVLARLLATAAVQPTLGPLGFLVGANWATIYTGTTPSRHQFLCSGQVRGDTYEPRWIGPITEPLPVWQWVSRSGGRVAVLDAPHSAAAELNGVQLTEWGCHDRHAGTRSYPASFVDEVNARYGAHPLGTLPTPFPHFAPCDIAHRAGAHRTLEENRALVDDLVEGHRRKRALSYDLLESQDWDLLFTVLGESHCTGHQFWKHHDPSHPWHNADELRVLGDPLRTVYAALDETVGGLLDRAQGATVFVHLSHGMRAHYDGTALLDAVLWRIDQYASGAGTSGPLTRTADTMTGALPGSLRARAVSGAMSMRQRLRGGLPVGAPTTVEIPAWVGQRRWWMQPNDSVYGSVRLNVEGREPNGRIAARRARDAALWLGERLCELVNVETQTPAVARVDLTEDHYERVPGDPMGDLIIEWNRDVPIDSVWSPASGLVSIPYTQWRTGDHHRSGLLLVCGPGITPGRRAQPMSVVDIAPTIAASLDLAVPLFDGVAHTDLLPEAATTADRAPARFAPPAGAPRRHRIPRRWPADKFDVNPNRWIEEYAVGLSRSLHAEHVAVHDLREEVDTLRPLAQITQVTAWLNHLDVAPSFLVSVVMPTRNRADLLMRAIATVQAQTYPSWELLVVDDASTDDTPHRLAEVAEHDPRIRPLRLDRQGRSSVARNFALDRAKGDIIVYLDDDNCFDPGWLKAVAWAFGEYPETEVCYGARVIDDDLRHQGLPGRSLPIVQFLPWDRDDILRANRVDQNVIAHRPSPVRFDAKIDHFSDWDLFLQLTDDKDPLPLPVIAAYYYSDVAERLSADFGGAHTNGLYDYVRRRAISRRQGDA